MGIRDRLRKLEVAARDETVLFPCLECGEESRVQDSLQRDLVAYDWAEEQERRRHKVYEERRAFAIIGWC